MEDIIYQTIFVGGRGQNRLEEGINNNKKQLHLSGPI